MSVTSQTKLPFWTKALFGAGAVGEMVYLGLFNTFIQIFYNQAIGLSNTLIGTAIMLAMIGDAISDPIVGLISDRWKSRHGRRHPFLFVAPIPLALTLWFIFHPPAALISGEGGPHQIGLFAWLAVLTILSRTFLTLYSVPHLALGAELSKNQYQRSQLFSANTVIGYLSGAGFAFLAWTVFFAGKRVRESDGALVSGQLDPAAYTPAVLLACCLIVIFVWLSAGGTYKRAQTLSDVQPDTPRLSFAQVFREIMSTLQNRNYVYLLLGYFFFMIASGIFDTMRVHIATYFWGLDGTDIRWLALIAAPAGMLGAFFAPLLMKKFDRKPVLIGALTGLLIFAQLVIDLRLLGLIPENGDPNLLPLLLANSAGFSFTVGLGAVTILSMIGDVIDQNELKTGLRQEGLFYSARAFFAKASYSFGHFFAGIMLDFFVRFPKVAIEGEVAPDVLFRMGLTAGPIMAIAGLISLLIYARYDLTREHHDEILTKINEKTSNEA